MNTTPAAKVEALAAEFDAAKPEPNYSRALEFNGNKRVVLVVASLVEQYGGRRFALQTQREDLGAWHTEAIIHSAHTAAVWLLLDDED